MANPIDREARLATIKPVGLKDYGATKMFNMFWIDQRLDEVLSELAKDKNKNVEIIQAVQLIEIARSLMKYYSDRLREAETS